MTHPRPDPEFARAERAFSPARVRFVLEHYGYLLDARPPGPARDADPGPVRHSREHAPAWEQGALERAAVAGAMAWLHALRPRQYAAVWLWYCRPWPPTMTAWEIAVSISRQLGTSEGMTFEDAEDGVLALARYLGWQGRPPDMREADPGP